MSTQTLIDNIKGLAADSAELLRAEAQLAQSETQEGLREMMGAFVMLAAGGVVALVALIMFADAAASWLMTYFHPAIASLIVGAFLAIVGAILFAIGRSRLDFSRLKPRRTIESMRTTAARMKEAA